jgi:hypothetical protein
MNGSHIASVFYFACQLHTWSRETPVAKDVTCRLLACRQRSGVRGHSSLCIGAERVAGNIDNNGHNHNDNYKDKHYRYDHNDNLDFNDLLALHFPDSDDYRDTHHNLDRVLVRPVNTTSRVGSAVERFPMVFLLDPAGSLPLGRF